MCKRCGSKVTRALDSIDAHETECGRQAPFVGDRGHLLEHSQHVGDKEKDLKRSFSSTVIELSPTELCRQLSTEGRALFTHALAEELSVWAGRSMDTLVSPSLTSQTHDRHERAAKLHTRDTLTNVIVGWQRYSVAFGSGRMGLEFEYDARETRRLVVTRVSKNATTLSIRARDVLIGIGNRAVPRAIDPLAVHRHLVDCTRPVTLHFYRLHVRKKKHLYLSRLSPQYADCSLLNVGRTGGPNVASSNVAILAMTSLQQSQNIARSDSREQHEAEASSSDVLLMNMGFHISTCLLKSEFLTPPVYADPLRYGMDDDGIPIGAGARCLLNASARQTLARALKSLLHFKPWELVYDSACDGMCLEALYARAGAAKRNHPQLIVCRDDLGHVAGAFLDEPVRNVMDRAGA